MLFIVSPKDDPSGCFSTRTTNGGSSATSHSSMAVRRVLWLHEGWPGGGIPVPRPVYPDLHWGKGAAGTSRGYSLSIGKHRAWVGSESTYGFLRPERRPCCCRGRKPARPKREAPPSPAGPRRGRMFHDDARLDRCDNDALDRGLVWPAPNEKGGIAAALSLTISACLGREADRRRAYDAALLHCRL
jgi:hypothetical protein